MKEEIRLKLNNIFTYPFFEQVGKSVPPSLKQVDSWQTAARLAGSKKWETCCLAARNFLQGSVETRNWPRTQDWNPLADELRLEIVTFADALFSKRALPGDIVKKVKPQLSWDIMLICLEEEYRDVVEPAFYIPFLDRWYAEGHFPCGWDGDTFPDRWNGKVVEGKLIVF